MTKNSGIPYRLIPSCLPTCCILLLQHTCYSFVVMATMYDDPFLEHKEKPCKGSV